MNDRKEQIEKLYRLGFGLIVHWGLYSHLEQGEWHLFAENPPLSQYTELMKKFTADQYDPNEWCTLAKEMGAGFIMLTARHHDGFSLYDTRGLNEYDAPHSAARRDLIAEFVDACRAHDIIPILYHTTLDWWWGGKKTPELSPDRFQEYLEYLRQSLEILCTQYGQIGGFFFDGNWSRPLEEWQFDKLYSMIRRHQPDTLIIDNTGLERPGVHDHPEIDIVTYEQHRIESKRTKPTLRIKTLNSHWGAARDDVSYIGVAQLIKELLSSRRYGAIDTINIGPLGSGAIAPFEHALLQKTGLWFKWFGKAFYNTSPSDVECEGDDFVLLDRDDPHRAYYYCYNLSLTGIINVTGVAMFEDRQITNLPAPIRRMRWLHTDEPVTYTCEGKTAKFTPTCYQYGTFYVVHVAEIEFETEK